MPRSLVLRHMPLYNNISLFPQLPRRGEPWVCCPPFPKWLPILPSLVPNSTVSNLVPPTIRPMTIQYTSPHFYLPRVSVSKLYSFHTTPTRTLYTTSHTSPTHASYILHFPPCLGKFIIEIYIYTHGMAFDSCAPIYLSSIYRNTIFELSFKFKLLPFCSDKRLYQ